MCCSVDGVMKSHLQAQDSSTYGNHLPLINPPKATPQVTIQQVQPVTGFLTYSFSCCICLYFELSRSPAAVIVVLVEDNHQEIS